ncbi:MAG: hypothetical protein GY746_05895 [Gammaproteobacteria bacterium]|nr:hypothetical protein [Gammaproteobacteria bacterium]
MVVSVIFSLVVLYQSDLINKDGIQYVLTAELLQNGQVGDAFRLYNWPFMPLLMSAVDKLTGVGIENSAYILNTLFDAALIVAFVLIVKELGGNVRVQIIAALVIFSLAYFNENRADIIRGHGYWFCYLYSLLLYLRFYRSPGLWLGLGWSATLLLGALFRIEGFAVWVALPLVVLFRSETTMTKKIYHFLQSYLLHLLILIVALVYISSSHHDLFMATKLKQIVKAFEYLLDGIGLDMDNRIAALKSSVLDIDYSGDYAIPALVSIFLLILGDKVLTAMTIPYAGLYVFPSLRAVFQQLDSRLVKVLIWAATINILVISIFLSRKFFLSARWVIPAALTLLLFVPFMLDKALDDWRSCIGRKPKYMRVTYIVFGLFVVYGMLDGLISTSPSKIYVKDAGVWIKNNIDKDSSIYTNYNRVLYYSGRMEKYRGSHSIRKMLKNISRRKLLRFDYLALQFRQSDAVIMERLNVVSNCLLEVKRFSGPRKSDVVIFKTRRDACNVSTR